MEIVFGILITLFVVAIISDIIIKDHACCGCLALVFLVVLLTTVSIPGVIVLLLLAIIINIFSKD